MAIFPYPARPDARPTGSRSVTHFSIADLPRPPIAKMPATPPEPMTDAELLEMVKLMGALRPRLRASDPAMRAKLYNDLGVHFRYTPGEDRIEVTVPMPEPRVSGRRGSYVSFVPFADKLLTSDLSSTQSRLASMATSVPVPMAIPRFGGQPRR